MIEDVECPYCEKWQEIDHDDGYGFQEDEVYQQCCVNCDKTFGYTTVIIYHYEACKMPCANGKEHELEDVKRYPEAFGVGKKRCVNCDEEILVDKEASRKAIEEYNKQKGLVF